jgi:hypothetical protein
MCVEVTVVLDVCCRCNGFFAGVDTIDAGRGRGGVDDGFTYADHAVRRQQSNASTCKSRMVACDGFSCALACACGWRVFVRSVSQFCFECFVVCCMHAQHALQN